MYIYGVVENVQPLRKQNGLSPEEAICNGRILKHTVYKEKVANDYLTENYGQDPLNRALLIPHSVV